MHRTKSWRRLQPAGSRFVSTLVPRNRDAADTSVCATLAGLQMRSYFCALPKYGLPKPLLTVIILACSLFGQSQPPQKTWKSQAEFDAYSAAAKETDAKKKLALVDAWK